MKNRIFALSLIFILLLNGCASSRQNASPAAATEAPAISSYQGDLKEVTSVQNSLNTAPGRASVSETDRLVIRTANMRVSVADPAKAVVDLSALANSTGGFVVSSNTWTSTSSQGVSYLSSNLTIRVPAEKLESIMAQIRAMAADAKTGVLSESVSGQDVTSEYTDSNSRLRVLEAEEQQLVKLLDSATSLEYTLDIFRELTSIRSEIEVLKGQIKYLEESAALSAISVEFVAEASLQPIEIGGWKPAGIIRDAIQSLIGAAQGLATFLIRFAIIWLPFLVPLALIIYFIRRGIKRRNARKQAKESNPPDRSATLPPV